MSRAEPQINIRVSEELKNKIKAKAEANGRSMNAEIVLMLKEAVAKPSPISGYRNEAERLADMQSEEFKKVVFETLKSIYKNRQ